MNTQLGLMTTLGDVVQLGFKVSKQVASAGDPQRLADHIGPFAMLLLECAVRFQD